MSLFAQGFMVYAYMRPVHAVLCSCLVVLYSLSREFGVDDGICF